MSYTLAIDKENGVIHLTYNGKVNLDIRKRARDEVFQACDEHQLSHALVDMRLAQFEITETGAIEFAQGFKDPRIPPDYRLACVVAPADTTDKIVEIIITLDHINVRYFYNIDEARQWLLAC